MWPRPATPSRDVNRRLAWISTEGFHARLDKVPLSGKSEADARAIAEVVGPFSWAKADPRGRRLTLRLTASGRDRPGRACARYDPLRHVEEEAEGPPAPASLTVDVSVPMRFFEGLHRGDRD